MDANKSEMRLRSIGYLLGEGFVARVCRMGVYLRSFAAKVKGN